VEASRRRCLDIVKRRNDATAQKHPAEGAANRPLGGVAALARPVLRSSGAAAAEGGCATSRGAPRLAD